MSTTRMARVLRKNLFLIKSTKASPKITTSSPPSSKTRYHCCKKASTWPSWPTEPPTAERPLPFLVKIKIKQQKIPSKAFRQWLSAKFFNSTKMTIPSHFPSSKFTIKTFMTCSTLKMFQTRLTLWKMHKATPMSSAWTKLRFPLRLNSKNWLLREITPESPAATCKTSIHPGPMPSCNSNSARKQPAKRPKSSSSISPAVKSTFTALHPTTCSKKAPTSTSPSSLWATASKACTKTSSTSLTETQNWPACSNKTSAATLTTSWLPASTRKLITLKKTSTAWITLWKLWKFRSKWSGKSKAKNYQNTSAQCAKKSCPTHWLRKSTSTKSIGNEWRPEKASRWQCRPSLKTQVKFWLLSSHSPRALQSNQQSKSLKKLSMMLLRPFLRKQPIYRWMLRLWQTF
jgi:hypothetical protein